MEILFFGFRQKLGQKRRDLVHKMFKVIELNKRSFRLFLLKFPICFHENDILMSKGRIGY